MASTAQPSSTRSWLRLVAFLFTALMGWFFGAYVGSMFSGPPESAVVTEQPAVNVAGQPPSSAAPGSSGGSPAQPPVSGSAPAIATVAPTQAPTAVPSPTPPGRGAMLEGEGLAIQLVDLEIRPESHPENAAIKYVLRFSNSTSRPIETQLNLADIQAMDNSGIEYRDYYALANRFAESRCGPGAARFQMNLAIQVPAQSSKQFDFYLNRATVEGSCANRGEGRSRVESTTQFVDVQLGTVAYTSDGPRQLQAGWWRLSRGG